ncbi:HAD-IB family hydrolase [Candidatus Laterigemmans baculatus]|uniref:HAD-IB family hydrolase n=1 Tax=Candidatus Laterigemmans baculatus TaxID=2770505 RepID=UPI0013DB1F4C|nr:HAD-IB family hydrolase [Candidatus Laterigemmans baculatus]
MPTPGLGEGPSDSRPLAIFDLDGTLTTRDSFLAYLISFGRRFSRYRAIAGMPFLLSGYLGKLLKDYELKQRLIQNFIAGVEPEWIHEHNQWFCEQWLPRHLHPVGHRLLQGHHRQSHRVILLSASPNIFVPCIAASLGIEEVVCTRVRQLEGIWQGQLEGQNCKGREKLAALQQRLALSERPSGSYSYGDSRSDLPVLSWVEHGAWVRRRDFRPLSGVSRSVFPWSEV